MGAVDIHASLEGCIVQLLQEHIVTDRPPHPYDAMARFSEEELTGVTTSARKFMIASLWQPLVKSQRLTIVDRGVRGPRWVSRTEFPVPDEDDARQLLLAAIRDLGDGHNEDFPPPDTQSVPVQWTGHRSNVSSDAPEPPGMTEQAKFDALTAEVGNERTIMYMYGGIHCWNGPATRRSIATTLSKLAGARCVIVQHRLAPQSPFPCQILDALLAYLSLLHPPPGSFHAPVDPRRLVLAGDSSGAQLISGIIQTILAARVRQTDVPTIRFHGRRVPVPLPAGIAVQSPGWGGFTPSWDDNLATDLFPEKLPWYLPGFPTDEAWPTSPPREHVYTPIHNYTHPLVHSMLATNWTGAPAMYIAMGGGEQSIEPAKIVAQNAARQGVPVIWDEYEKMPHNWPMLLPAWPQSLRCVEEWAAACVRFTQSAEVKSAATIFTFEPDTNGERKLRPLDGTRLVDFSERDIMIMVRRGIATVQDDARESMSSWKSRL